VCQTSGSQLARHGTCDTKTFALLHFRDQVCVAPLNTTNIRVCIHLMEGPGRAASIGLDRTSGTSGKSPYRLIAETHHSTIELVPHPKYGVAVRKKVRRADERSIAKWRNEVSILRLVHGQVSPHFLNSSCVENMKSSSHCVGRHISRSFWILRSLI
jgi:hypothetical protein